MNIQELIKNIRKRPLMYIAELRLDYIEHFISGVSCGCLSDDNSIDKMFPNYFQKYIIKWIRENIDANYEVNSLWFYKSIRDVTKDEHQAVEMFFELCDSFFDEYNRTNGKMYN